MEERHIDDTPLEILPAWQTHDWTVQEVRFASEYLLHGNQARAYRAAFDQDATVQSASTSGRRLLMYPWMAGYLAHINDAIRERMALTKENVLLEIAKLGFANFSDFVVLQEDGTPQFDLSGLSRDQMASIAEMTIDTYTVGKSDPANEGREVRSVKVKLAPKLGALEALGKHLKLFTDVVEHSVTDVAEEVRRAREERQQRLAARNAGEDDEDRKEHGNADSDADAGEG